MRRTNPRLPMPVLGQYEWQERAACRDVDPELFFSAEAERGVSKLARESVAKSLCRTCPVQSQCRAHAVSVGEPYGVWGGTTEDEREHDTLDVVVPPPLPAMHEVIRPPAPEPVPVLTDADLDAFDDFDGVDLDELGIPARAGESGAGAGTETTAI